MIVSSGKSKISTLLSLALFTPTLRLFKISHRASVSVISGTLQIVTSSSDKTAAGIKATVAFLAPDTLMDPVNLCPPSISIIFILNLHLPNIYYNFVPNNVTISLTLCFIFSSPEDIIFLGS